MMRSPAVLESAASRSVPVTTVPNLLCISAGLSQVGGGRFAEDVGAELIAGDLAARCLFDGNAAFCRDLEPP